MKLTLLVLVSIFGGISTSLTVTEEVMSFLLGCGSEREGRSAIPLSRTDVDPDTGTTVQEVTMMDVAQMRDMLLETVESEDVVSYIVGMVEKTLHSQQELMARQGCTNVKIDVPPQEVKGLAETIQAVVQQNNYQLLEQVNTLFSFKLNSFYTEVETLLNGKLEEIRTLNKENPSDVPASGQIKSDTKIEQAAEPQIVDKTDNTHNEKVFVLKKEGLPTAVEKVAEPVKVEEPIKEAAAEVVKSENSEVVSSDKLRAESISKDSEVLSEAEPEPEPEGDYVPEPESEPEPVKKSKLEVEPKASAEPEPEPEPQGGYVSEPEPEPQGGFVSEPKPESPATKKYKNEITPKSSQKVDIELDPEPKEETEPEADPAPEAEPEPEPESEPTQANKLKREPPKRPGGPRRSPAPIIGAPPSLKSRVPPRRISLTRPSVNQESKSEKVQESTDEGTIIAEEEVNKEQEEEAAGVDPRRRRMEAMLAQRRKMANRFREG